MSTTTSLYRLAARFSAACAVTERNGPAQPLFAKSGFVAVEGEAGEVCHGGRRTYELQSLGQLCIEQSAPV